MISTGSRSAGDATDTPPVRTIDARLLPGAVTVWTITLVGLFLGPLSMVIVTVSTACAVPVVARFGLRRRWGNGVVVALVLAGTCSAALAVRLHQVEHHWLRERAHDGVGATVRVVLRDAPQPLEGSAYGGRRANARSIVRAELTGLRVDEDRVGAHGWVPSRGEVLLLVPTRHWRDLHAGQRVTVRGEVIPPRKGDLLVAVISASREPRDVAAAPAWQRVAEDMREGLRRGSAAVLGQDAAGLLPGLVVGDTGALPETVVREFRRAGLSHLTAVSGANLAIVSGAVLLVMRLVSAGPVLSAAAAGAALVGFVVLAGPEPSVLRAAVMGAITLLALVLGRDRSALPALSATVIGLLVHAPELATSAGFALSVAATAALVLVAPSWSAALHARGVPVGAAQALAVPAAAQLAAAPLVAALSGQISVVAVAANVLAGPVVAPATVLGVGATVLMPWVPALGEVLIWLAGPELRWILLVAHHASAVPGATVSWPDGTAGGLLLVAAIIVALLVLRHRRLRGTLVALLLVAVVVIVPVRVVRPGWPVDGWSLVACDVAQGDSLVLATGREGSAVVIDTGPRPAVTDACLRRLGVDHVPLVVLTHLHADHVSGLPGVLADRRVGAVAVGGLREPEWAMREVRTQAREAGVPIVRLSAGQRLRWPGLVLDVLGPAPSLLESLTEEEVNDASLVIMATTRSGRALLTGDIELRAQSSLLASGADLRADILKVAHHGSRYTRPRFLRAVHPRLALVSVGHGNDYGHPSPAVLGVLRGSGATVVRTDRKGDIAVVGEQGSLRVVSRGDPLRPEDT